jgi:hypothetical protein
MATQKDREFIEFLIQETAGEKIHWEATAAPDQFVVGFKGKYKVFVDYMRPDEERTYYVLTLKDEADRELVTVADFEDKDVKKLYHLAQRDSLSVDKAIDEIMGSPGPTQIKDDDIPF